MEGLRQYIISVITAAMICGLVTAFSGSKTGSSMKMIAGLFLTMTIVTPFFQIKRLDFSDIFVPYIRESEQCIAYGEKAAQDATAQIIKEQVCAYILDKAESLGLTVSIEVFLEEKSPYLPDRISISGSVSPQDKARLESYISETLGIPKEKQQWTGQIHAAAS